MAGRPISISSIRLQKIVYVCPDNPGPPPAKEDLQATRAYRALVSRLMDERNAAMVCDSDNAVAVWDGTPGGTGNCVGDLQRFGRLWVRVNPASILSDPFDAPLEWRGGHQQSRLTLPLHV